jgi:hypothetical protein
MPDPFFAASPADIPDRDTVLSLSGLDFMQRVVDGTLPQAPMARAMNFRLAAGRPWPRGLPRRAALRAHEPHGRACMAAGTARFSTAAWAAR